MKPFKNIILLFCTIASTGIFASIKADSLGLPGDNFDLYAALELFKKSNSPEEFEKAINSSDNEINNLDLNADGKVDYVKVIDKSKGDAHSMVLQVDVSKTETQDVAVIEMEKTKDNNVHLQIVGDEELYGKNYIVEPSDETAAAASTQTTQQKQQPQQQQSDDDVYASPNNGSSNYNNNNNYNNNYSSPPVVVNVWGWPSVQYVYGPVYNPWVSPWYWGYYPNYWQPWGPIYWGYYHRSVYRWHQPYFHRTNFYTCNVAHNYYYGRRTTSITVNNYNRSGMYNKQQIVYRQNTPEGKRYNSAPANVQRQQSMNKQVMQEQKSGNFKNNAVNEQPNKMQGQNNGQPKEARNKAIQNNSEPKMNNQPKQQQVNNEPKQMKEPKQMNEPKQVNSQPRQQNTQPAQQVEKQQQPAMQKPQKQFGGGGAVRSGGGGGGIRSGGGGGGMRSGGGGGGGRRGR